MLYGNFSGIYSEFMARLAFFGTPNFSIPSLKALYRYCRDFGHEIVMVVTQSDQPQGRGQKLSSPPVKIEAQNLGLSIFQPTTLKKGTVEGDEFFVNFRQHNVDLAIVVAYGKILSERILRSSKNGFVNVHASLLPRFRGAAPVQRAIAAGDRESGVCLMEVVKKLDEGDVFALEKTPILPFDNSESLLWRLAHLGAHLLYDKLTGLLDETLEKIPQSEAGVVYAHRIDKKEAILDFSESVRVISNKVRAFDPAPGSFGYIRGKRIKLFDSFFIIDHLVWPDTPFGTVVVTDNFLGIKGQDGIVYFQGMQVEGKRAQPFREAILGFPIAVGDQIVQTK